MMPEEISQISTPQGRATAAHNAVRQLEDLLQQVRELRAAAVVDLRVTGWTQRAIAGLLDVSPAMIAQIDRAEGTVSARVVRRSEDS